MELEREHPLEKGPFRILVGEVCGAEAFDLLRLTEGQAVAPQFLTADIVSEVSVLDHEQAVLGVAGDMLARMGYSVLRAASGPEAPSSCHSGL